MKPGRMISDDVLVEIIRACAVVIATAIKAGALVLAAYLVHVIK